MPNDPWSEVEVIIPDTDPDFSQPLVDPPSMPVDIPQDDSEVYITRCLPDLSGSPFCGLPTPDFPQELMFRSPLAASSPAGDPQPLSKALRGS